MIQNINNGVVTGPKSMPQKDITSNGESEFQLGRTNYVRSLFTTSLTLEEKQQKKWYQNRDASSVISKRKNNSIGNGSLNASGGLFSMTTIEDKNSQNSALRRVRAGGSVAPAKKANRPVLYDMPLDETAKQFVIQYKVDNVTLSELTDTQKTTLKNNAKTDLAQQLGISENDITVELIAGSVIYKFTIDSTNTDENHEILKQNIENNSATISNTVLADIQAVTNNSSITLDSNYGGVITEIDPNAEPEPEPVPEPEPEPVPEPEPEPDDSFTFFTHTNGTVYPIDIVGELSDGSYVSTISKTNIREVQIGTNVTELGSYAFQGCTALQSANIPASVTRIMNGTFHNCSQLQSVTIPDNVNYIGQSAFYNCSQLQSVTIPDNLNTILDETFYNCDALQSLTLGNNVRTIYSRAFAFSNNLRSVYVSDSVINIVNNAFEGNTALTQVYMSQIARNNLGLSFGPNQSFFGTNNVTIINN